MSCCSPLGPSAGGCCGPTGSPLILDTATLCIRTLAGPTTTFPEPLAPYWAPDGTLNAGLVEAWGAGGGASAAVGGGGGAYAAATKLLTGGLAVTGLSGNRTAVDTNGADVNIGGVIAQGGRSGTNGGTGGLASASTGTTKFDGGTAGDAGSSGGGSGSFGGAGALIIGGGQDGGFGGQGLLDPAFGPHFPGGGGQKASSLTQRGACGAGRIRYYRPRAAGRPALIDVTWFRNVATNANFALPQGEPGDFLVFFLNGATTTSPTITTPGIVMVNVQVYTLLATSSGPATAQMTTAPGCVICWRFRHASGVGSATSIVAGPPPIPNPIGPLSSQYSVLPPVLAGGPGYGVALTWQRHTNTTPDFQPMTELVAAPSGYNNVIHMPNEGIGANSTFQQSSFSFDYVEANYQAPGPFTFQGASVGALVPGNAIGAATLIIT